MDKEAIIIDGADVDPWLSGLIFEYDGENVTISEESKEKFDSFDQIMWYGWVLKYVEENH